MPPVGVRGPSAFLVTLGIVVTLLGAMIFLAIPAANRLDAKELDRSGTAPSKKRSDGIIKGGVVALSVGSVLVAVGFSVKNRRHPRG